MNYIKHLIECQCSLPLFANKSKPVYHKIPVFSLLDENSNIQEKYIICDNCDIVHRVYEIFKSEIKWGSEGIKSLVVTKEDIKFNLIANNYKQLSDLLEEKNVYVADWEIVEHLMLNDLSGYIILEKNDTDNNTVITVLNIDKGKYSLKKEILQRYL